MTIQQWLLKWWCIQHTQAISKQDDERASLKTAETASFGARLFIPPVEHRNGFLGTYFEVLCT
jgi:hypothetical protein